VLGIFLLAELGWFGLLHPLVPANIEGFAIEFAAGIAVAAIVWGALQGISWLTARKSNLLLCRMAAVALALSVGVAIFVAAYLLRDGLGANFRYFIFAHH
jgi:hypothetical protein